jgi:lysophospholipase L1-like esterase
LSRLSGPAAGLVAVAVLLGGLEVVARIAYAPAKQRGRTTYVSADPTLPVLTTFADLDRHDQRGIYKGILYQTNHLRLRSPERPAAKPVGTVRLAVLGDSFAMGQGVLAEDSYAWRLEHELPRVKGGRYETINTAISGLDAAHAVARYAELGLPYNPDIAIYGFTINDIEGPHYVESVTARLDRYGLERSPFALWRMVGPGYVAVRERWLPPAGTFAHELAHNYFENPAAWSDFLTALDRLREINEQRGICTVMFLHTHLVTLNALHPFTSIYDKVAAAGRDRGFLVIPSLPAFLGRKDKDLWVSPDDPHPNEEGHRLLAEALAQGLAELPEACWRAE